MNRPKSPVRIIGAMLLVSMLVGWILLPSIGIEFESLGSASKTMMVSTYSPHGPILINSDSDFLNQGWPGSGTEEEPFVIEGLNITYEEECIVISNTRAFFELRDCLIVSHGSYTDAAIEFENVTDATIQNCIVDSYQDGIHFMNVNDSHVLYNTVIQAGTAFEFEYVNNCEILNNYAEGVNRAIWNWGYGFRVYYSSHCIVHNNTANDRYYLIAITLAWSTQCELTENRVLDGDDYGICIYNSDNSTIDGNLVHLSEQAFWIAGAVSCIISRNTMSENGGGIFIDGSRNLTIIGNLGFDNADGWQLEDSRYCTLTDNEFEHGLFIEGSSLSYWLHIISNNVVDGKPMGCFVNESGMTIEASSYSQVILVNCSEIQIANGLFHESSGAIELAFCRNCTVKNISVYGYNSYAFYLEHSNQCNVTRNLAVGTGFCAFLIRYSVNCTVTRNTVSKAIGYGFDLYASGSCVISNNFVDGPDWAYSLRSSGISTITSNKAYRGMFGYDLQSSSNCTLFNNTAMANSENGVRLFSSAYTLVYLNRFAYNAVNADDLGTQNEWNNCSHGNYWSDYESDGTYTIPGSAGSVDEHPFALTSDPPEIDSLGDIEYYSGSTGNQIEWQPHADFPNTYAVYLNGMTWESGTWNGSSIVIDIDGFAIGIYNFTIRVNDYEGRSARDMLNVTVMEVPTITPTTSTTTRTSTSTTTTGPSNGPQELNFTTIILFCSVCAAVVLILLIDARRNAG